MILDGNFFPDKPSNYIHTYIHTKKNAETYDFAIFIHFNIFLGGYNIWLWLQAVQCSELRKLR